MSSGGRRVIAGAMSGTSADGVDVALVEITGRGLEMSAKLLHHHARAYDAGLRQRIFAVREAGHIGLAELAALGRDISLAYAAAVNAALREANLTAADLAAVAARGRNEAVCRPARVVRDDRRLVGRRHERAVARPGVVAQPERRLAQSRLARLPVRQ